MTLSLENAKKTLWAIWERIKAIVRYPFDLLFVFGLDLQARYHTLTRPKLTYRALNAAEAEIRLLKIHPRVTARPNEPIRCSLMHVPLAAYTADYKAWEAQADPTLQLYKKFRAWCAFQNARPVDDPHMKGIRRFEWGDYLALSYAWGSYDLSKRMILNGQFVPITESLESALFAVREDPRVILMGVYLWVDAISINQDDLFERSKEIKTMRRIFGDSMGVFVHLGAPADDSNLAFELVRLLAYNLKQGFDYRRFLMQLGFEANEGKAPKERRAYIALLKLLCRPYWHRLWIIQELAVGDDDITVHCGNDMVFLHQIRQSLRLLLLNATSFGMIASAEVFEGYNRRFQSTTSLLWWLGRLRQVTTRPENQNVISYQELRSPILALGQYATATDPRDKIFGIVGILPTSITRRIDTNPLLSVRDVYVNFTKTVLEVTGDLDMIFARNLQQNQLTTFDLPTWTTDWTLAPDRSGMFVSNEWDFVCDPGYEASEESYGRTKRLTVDTGEFPNPRADGGRKSQIHFVNNDSLLVCEGFCIGTIDGIVNGVVLQDTPAATRTIFRQPSTTHSPYGDEAATAAALLRTLFLEASGEASKQSALLSFPWIGGEDQDEDEDGNWLANAEDLEVMSKLRDLGWGSSLPGGSFFLFEQLRRALRKFRLAGKLFKDYFPSEIQQCEEGVNLSHDFGVIVANAMCRCLVTTKTGHFGYAPHIVKHDDEIFVLLGCTVPLILRKDSTGKYHEVVGECYVDGFMKGEALQALDAGEFHLETITLC